MTGGRPAVARRPSLDTVTCRAACAGLDRVRPGSTVRINGVVAGFGACRCSSSGRKGRRDDRFATRRRRRRAAAIEVVVPKGARTGKLRVVEAGGRTSRATRRTPARRRQARRRVLQARVDARRVFVGGDAQGVAELLRRSARPPSRSRSCAAATPTRWPPGHPATSPAGTRADGRVGRPRRRRAAARGPLRLPALRNAPRGRAGRAARRRRPWRASCCSATASRSPARTPTARAPARFGAARGGYSHQGQDVFAACGTPLVAAEGGTVKHKATHERAGNYIVIAGEQDGFDYAYMHLRDAALVNKGDQVVTGQPIGFVGQTGRASGCHLHFEMWARARLVHAAARRSTRCRSCRPGTPAR